jgi:hypothetical protein
MHEQIQTTMADPLPQDTRATRPYPPSFIDRFLAFVDRLPGPSWLALLVLFVLQSLAVHAMAWIDGWLAAPMLEPILFLFPLWLWLPLAIIAYLNAISLEALSSFSPLLDLDEDGLERLKAEFTTMPARGVLLSGVIWAGVYLILLYLTFDAVSSSLGLGLFLMLVISLEGLVAFSVGSAIYYHSLRQLRLVNRTVKMIKQVNLFQLDPVYAFSRVTSRAGISWMILLSFTLLLYPIQLTNVPILGILVLQLVLALAAFVLPLRLVNYHLVSEKRRLLAELNQRVERTLDRLHRCLDDNELGEMEQLSDAIANLNAEREILTKIPIWPWRAGTLTSFLSAIVLPIVLLLIQVIIESFFGG